MAQLNAADVSVRVELAAGAETVWRRATTLDGVNEELRPWLRMTAPEGLRGASISDLEPGVGAGRSWLLLAGVLPVDYDDLTLAEIEPPRRFLERSRMLTMELWQHERVVEPLGDQSCAVIDRLTFTLRPALAWLPGLRGVARALVGLLFRHRHRRLAAMHGAVE